MAKFKKKKSAPTPDPEESKKESIPEQNEIPQTESSGTTSDSPTEPATDRGEKSEKDKKLDKLFWLRVIVAAVAGTLATFLFEDIEGEERRWASIVFMIGVFVVTIFIAKGMNMQLPSSDRKKIVTQGIGSYVFIYLFMWIVSYTIVHTSIISSGIRSPIS